jgi:DNA-binding NarL/FixJ family response regulator
MKNNTQPSREVPAARLIVVDDHELARAGLRSILDAEPNLEVVGEATTGRAALTLCRRMRPDLVMMDVRMPDVDGLAATRAIKQDHPNTQVILITMHENPVYLLEALKAGAAGYVLKGASKREILGAVRQVLRGEAALHPELATQLLRRMAGETSEETNPPPARLTPRELDVLRLLARGQTNREIASELSLSLSTVKAHIEHIIAKLGVSDRTQAAVRAVELKLLTDPRP